MDRKKELQLRIRTLNSYLEVTPKWHPLYWQKYTELESVVTELREIMTIKKDEKVESK